jgi:hypothetical protein
VLLFVVDRFKDFYSVRNRKWPIPILTHTALNTVQCATSLTRDSEASTLPKIRKQVFSYFAQLTVQQFFPSPNNRNFFAPNFVKFCMIFVSYFYQEAARFPASMEWTPLRRLDVSVAAGSF